MERDALGELWDVGLAFLITQRNNALVDLLDVLIDGGISFTGVVDRLDPVPMVDREFREGVDNVFVIALSMGDARGSER
jgi:hypothetical protein